MFSFLIFIIDFLERERVACAGSFILPECICTYHQVSNDIYHSYTACADNSKTDSIKHLTCKYGIRIDNLVKNNTRSF